ncbi:MAG: hypothetical protein VYA34_04520 [Myxococcota bacterium]|nr:hypothetical protein [Myxococcota bacterium]
MIKLFISLSCYFWFCLILAVFSGPIVLANIAEASEKSFGKVVVSDPKSGFEAKEPIPLKVISDDVFIVEEDVVEQGSEETKDAPSSEDKGIVIVEEAQSESSESLAESVVIVMEDPEEVEEKLSSVLELPSRTFTLRWKRKIRTQLLVDTAFENTDEDAVEWWNLAGLRLEARSNDGWSAVTDVLLRWGVTGEKSEEGTSYYLLNSRDLKWSSQSSLREAYVRYAWDGLEVYGGTRIFSWGRNEFLAAGDVINPASLQYDVLGALTSTRDSKVAVAVLGGAYAGDTWSVEMVVIPFFRRAEAFVFGRDFSLFGSGSDLEAQIRAVAPVHPSIEDDLQRALVGTEKPWASMENFSLALRGDYSWPTIDVGLSLYWGWDSNPSVWLDDDLRMLLKTGAARIPGVGVGATLIDPTDPVNARVQQKLTLGQTLLEVDYERILIGAIDVQWVLGEVIVKFDFGGAPNRTFYRDSFDSIRLPSAQLTLGLEYNFGEEFYIQVTGFSQVVFNIPEGIWLQLFDDLSRTNSNRNSKLSWLGGAFSSLRYSMVDFGGDFELATLMKLKPFESVVLGKFTYRDLEPHEFFVGCMFLTGALGGTLKPFEESDLVFMGYQATW